MAGAKPRAQAAGRQTRPRVLFIAEAVTLSHVVRPDILARALHDQGYEIVFAADPRYDALFAPRPFTVLPLRSSIRRDDPAASRSTAGPLFDASTLARYVAEDVRLIRAAQPDVVVGDMRHSLAFAAWRTGVPSVTLLDAQFSPLSDVELEVAPPAFMPPLDERLGALMFKAVAPFAHWLHTLPANMMLSAQGRDTAYHDVRELWAAGDFVAYPDLPGFVPMRALPPAQRFIGPLLWTPAVDQPFWWDSLPSDRPIVFLNVSPSSPGGLVPLALEALSGLDVTVIATAGPKRSAGAAGPNAYLADALPGSEAAGRADLTICNGGNMAAYQSLGAGTPVLGLPAYPEQLMFSRCLARNGVGAMLAPGEYDAAALRAKVAAMLADRSYAEAASRFADEAACMDPGHLFKTLVDDAIAEHASRCRALS